MIGSFKKLPNEVLSYVIDYNSFVPYSDAITSCVISVDDTSLNTNYPVVIDSKGVKVTVMIGTGTPGKTYTVTIVSTTQNGIIKQDNFRITIVQ